MQEKVLRDLLDDDMLEWQPHFYVEFKTFKMAFGHYCTQHFEHASRLVVADLVGFDPRLNIERKRLTVQSTGRQYYTWWCIGCRLRADIARMLMPAAAIVTTDADMFRRFLVSDYLIWKTLTPSEAIDVACEEGVLWYMPKSHFLRLYRDFREKECGILGKCEADLEAHAILSYHGRMYVPQLKSSKMLVWIIGPRQNFDRGSHFWP